ncbi:MAG: hypothetical protein KGJ28_13260 [Alphaproteobacteria bacterium]|nr:hypothetical protein [Alphaproteobacteria bacterium]
MNSEELIFRIETWTQSDSTDRVLAKVGNLIIAHATFGAAVQAYPTSRIVLRHHAHVISRHEP